MRWTNFSDLWLLNKRAIVILYNDRTSSEPLVWSTAFVLLFSWLYSWPFRFWTSEMVALETEREHCGLNRSQQSYRWEPMRPERYIGHWTIWIATLLLYVALDCKIRKFQSWQIERVKFKTHKKLINFLFVFWISICAHQSPLSTRQATL